jgi:predicted ribosome quality control (RQC) complex YloA/Tae2 family protein
MLSSGIGWNDITRMVKEERKAGNPLANLIYKINFEKNVVSLILDAVDESQHHQIEIDDHLISNFDPVMKIDVDLTVSAQLNIMRYFEIKKKSFQKEVKTKEAAHDAIKKAEVTAAKDFEKFKQSQVKANMNRKVFWFEKFIWFVTSENHLVIGGRNAQQNEALVKRYMDKHDLFMHSELHGASVCILKNPSGLPVPSLSLMEAATFEMCHSPCWEAKVLA